MRPIFTFLVRQRPPVAVAIITAAKEEVRRSGLKSETSVVMCQGWMFVLNKQISSPILQA